MRVIFGRPLTSGLSLERDRSGRPFWGGVGLGVIDLGVPFCLGLALRFGSLSFAFLAFGLLIVPGVEGSIGSSQVLDCAHHVWSSSCSTFFDLGLTGLL